MQSNGLSHLYVEQLRDLHNAESQLLKALPKMAKAATSESLKHGFEKHLEQTKTHVDRLEQIFAALEESPKGRKCAGMEGLIAEGEEIMNETPADRELDAGLIAAAQRLIDAASDSEDFKEGRRAFAEKRPPRFRGE